MNIAQLFGKISIAITFMAVAIVSFFTFENGYEINSLNYLYPRLDNFDGLLKSGMIPFAVVMAVLCIVFLILILFSIKIGFGKIIAFILSSVLLLIDISFISMSLNFDSYTKDINNYMQYDTCDGPINEVQNFFLQKEEVTYYQNQGIDVEYEYCFEYPMFTNIMEYEITLKLSFENNGEEFEHLWSKLISEHSPSVGLDETEIFIKNANVVYNHTNTWVLHKITADFENKIIVFYANMEFISKV